MKNKNTKKMYTAKINKYGYEFNIDMENTQQMYASRSYSSINVRKQLPDLVKFLDELGIDIRKPDEYDSDFSDVIYTFIGSAISQEGYEIDMYGENQYVSIVVYDEDGIVKLEVFGMSE